MTTDPLIAPYSLGFSYEQKPVFTTQKGISEETVRAISHYKNEPHWMCDKRLAAYKLFTQMKLPTWGADLSRIDFDDITYFATSTESQMESWEDLPDEIKATYDRIGVPQAERDFLAGVSAQYDSEVVYESVRHELTKQGVLFCDMDAAVKLYPDIVKEYFGTLIPAGDNMFAALNTAVWSGGSFVYVPQGVHVTLPLQAYFRINAERFGQFERTLIVAEDESFVHYVEGCSAPIYTTDSLHAAVVEIFVKPRARVRYTTVQNWSSNVYNLVTKRARAEEYGIMEWIDCNIGSKVTMKYPSVVLAGEHAHGEVLSIAYAGSVQHQDTGAKMIHLAPYTTSRVVSKSISKNTGRSSYRGQVVVHPNAHSSKVYVSCDALLLDEHARTDTYPHMKIHCPDTDVQHEATVAKIGEETLGYLMSRGIAKPVAEGLLVNGFMEPITREIPLEYTVELNRLIQLEMEGSVG